VNAHTAAQWRRLLVVAAPSLVVLALSVILRDRELAALAATGLGSASIISGGKKRAQDDND